MPDDAQYGTDVQELLDLLQKNKILKDFWDAFETSEDLVEFAKRAEFGIYEQGTQVMEQGKPGNDFFIVMSGQLRAIDVENYDEPHLLSYFGPGEIAGEYELLAGSNINVATVEVVIAAKLAFFNEDDWYWLIGKNSRIRTFFEDLEGARSRRAKVDFPGRQWDEVVVAATKRHFVAFVATLPTALMLLIAPLFFFMAVEIIDPEFSSVFTRSLTLLATLPFVAIAGLLIAYNYFDWRNDDFIVTTKRVVHIERILFFGQKRREAPLTRIQDVTLLSDILDRVFDSDTVRISTAGVGIIEFSHIRQADAIRKAIFEERERAKARVAAADVAALRHNIAHELNWGDGIEENVMAVAEAEGTLVHQEKTHHYNRFIDYFVPRIKEVNDTSEGTVIVWRKHYYILLKHIFLPTLALLASLYIFIASFILWLPPFTAALTWPIQIILGVPVLASMFWYIWEYDDWSKDIYILTNTQIIDIESSAFRLRRTRREGTFDNIQGVYSEVPNFFYKMLNLGDVIIETAGTQDTFTFKNVFDPASVNKEIFNRWAVYQQRAREKQRNSTTNQVMEVLKEYHKLAKKVEQ